MTRVIGPTGSRRRRRFLIVPILLAAALGLFFTVGAQAIHVPPDSSLELDGNVKHDAYDDWNDFCTGTPPVDPATGCLPANAPGDVSFTTGIVPDPEPQTIFTGAQSGGSSKDAEEISGWRWKCGSVPSKDEISDAASARYNVSGESRLYLMADREAVAGDSHLGVWLLRKNLTAGGCPAASANEFSDGTSSQPTHSPRTAGPDGIFGNADDERGDILLLADFTQGGVVPNIKVFEWYGTGGNTPKSGGTLNDVAIGGDCIGYAHPPGEDLCATVNRTLLGPGSPNGPAWTYSPKSGDAQSYPPGSFFEAGIDLTSFGLSGECFGSVLTETRSSAEIDAVLKDFVLHVFQPCESAFQTNASAGPVTVGGTFTDTATVSGVGGGPPTGTVTFTVCGPFAAPTACTASDPTAASAGVRTLNGTDNPATVTSDTVNATGVGYYCFLGVYSGDNHYDPAQDSDTSRECVQVVQLQPQMTTAQRFRPNDSANITVVSGGGDLAGNVRFQLFVNDATCSGTAAYDSGPIDVTTGTGSGLDRTVSSNNTTEYVTTGTTFSWLVTYTSTNTGHKNVTAACNAEHSSITIDNDGTFNTP
jgi:hypothetical protein